MTTVTSGAGFRDDYCTLRVYLTSLSVSPHAVQTQSADKHMHRLSMPDGIDFLSPLTQKKS